MTGQPVKGPEAVKRMARQVLNPSLNSQNEKVDDKGEWDNKAKEARSERVYLEEQKRIDRMTQPPDSQSREDGGKDPLEEAQKFTKQMAANALIENELAKSKAAVSKAEAEASEAKTKAERAQKGGAEGVDSPFKVSGSIDMGKFNYQDLLKEQSDDLKQLKKEADQAAANQAAVSDDLRERLHAKEMEVLTTSFAAQMEVLKKMVDASASRGSFMEQYNGVMEMAKTIGFSQPQLAGDVTQTMALEKMKWDQNIELKRMAREEKRADREFQRQLNRDTEEREQRLKRYADETEAKKEERVRQSRRDDMIANAPQVIGGAIAQGLRASKSKGGMVTEEASAEASAEAKAPKGKQEKHVEAGWGDSGELECPTCSQPLAIGPTAKVALCANCGESVPIRRGGRSPSAEEGE